MAATAKRLEIRESAVLDELPILRLLPDDVRALVVNSFVPTSFPFGAVIAPEGQAADAMFVIVSGRARMIKRGDGGEEIPLQVLRAGETWGEIEMLAQSSCPVTIRASSDVVALRLDRSVFDALLRTHPEVQIYCELQLKHARLRHFFRGFPSFAELPAEAVMAIVLTDLEPVVVDAGHTIVRQGDAPGPVYLVDDGDLRAFAEESGTRRYLRRFVCGDFFGERSVFTGSLREATVEALSRCRLLVLSEETYRRLLSDVPGFRACIQEHINRHDYARLAKVPADFSEEMLPAAASPTVPVSSSRVDDEGPEHSPDDPFAVEGRFVKRRRRIRRFPFVQQIDEMDCGAACLAMICRQHGRAVALARVRQLVHAGRDGTSLRSLCHAAGELGLAARAVKVSPRHLDRMPLPAIVHWEGNHWVLLADVTATHVRIADPALGVRRLTISEFHDRWTGYAALFDYTEAFERAPAEEPTIAWLWSFVRPYSGVLLRSVGLALVVSVLQMLLPVFTQVVVDRVLVERDVALLNVLIVAMAVVMIFIVASIIVQRYLVSFAAVRIDSATLDFLAGRLLALPMSYFAGRRTGDIQRRLAGARQIRDFLVQHGLSALMATVKLAAAMVLMAIYSRTLTMVFLGCVPLYGLLMIVSSRVLQPLFDRVEDAFGRYHSHQIDAIKGIETVKAMAGEHGLRGAMLTEFQGVARQLFRADFTAMSYEGAVQAVSFLSMGLMLWAGAYQVMNGALTIGGLVAFNALAALANAPIVTLLGVWDNWQRSAVLVNRLHDIFEAEPEQGRDRTSLRTVRDLEGHISLRDVGFRYGGPDSPAILSGITFDIAAGTRVAIVGRSGSGKTTLARCLAGLVEPTEGSILYDGVDLETLNYRSLRQRIGLVLQDSFLFADTIARNIAFGEDDPDMERVRWAAAMANARDFIERLPLQYETLIGESGIALSGGQRQRIAIARALYRQPPILILDEATSSLDSESEKLVQENLDTGLQRRTSIVIAHRLSTIRRADIILVLEKGRLVEHGTHRELVERQGLYYYLSSQQLAFAEAS